MLHKKSGTKDIRLMCFISVSSLKRRLFMERHCIYIYICMYIYIYIYIYIQVERDGMGIMRYVEFSKMICRNLYIYICIFRFFIMSCVDDLGHSIIHYSRSVIKVTT